MILSSTTSTRNFIRSDCTLTFNPNMIYIRDSRRREKTKKRCVSVQDSVRVTDRVPVIAGDLVLARVILRGRL